MIENRFIESSSISLLYSNNFKEFNFSSLWRGSNNYSEDDGSFIFHKWICFEDYVGDKLLTANELLYYPELAEKIKEIKEYPTLKRTYTVDQDRKGIDFIQYFLGTVLEAHNHFKAELDVVSGQVNNLIKAYGCRRYLPIVEQYEQITGYQRRQYLTINGIKWGIEEYRDERNLPTYLDIYRLFNISRGEFIDLIVEEVKIGTPFIALRKRQSWAHKGHVSWYNLNTCLKVSKTEVAKWKKPE